MGELLAFGSLLWDGALVRMSGQDCRRGTFSQRHAVLVDSENGKEWNPLSALHDKQGEFRIYDSSLSEAGIMGFEFGYSLDYPDGLVGWEAQFGDFVNGAQVIVDQFISSSEDKWGRISGLTLLLPHGYEGQGPEHSSARYERFLQLGGEDNIQVVYPSTPAQYFHVLRRQVVRRWRKPLVVLTPKSLLRLPACVSTLEELERGRFQRLLDDVTVEPLRVERLLLCTGKVYYDLAEERARLKTDKVAIARLEQLYPLRDELITGLYERYPNAREVVWVQEEPENMGARHFLCTRLPGLTQGRSLHWIHRPESASPATGSSKAHAIEQRRLVDAAFGKLG
jgi:2-oxoglutarate dehydrogenase E1 component